MLADSFYGSLSHPAKGCVRINWTTSSQRLQMQKKYITASIFNTLKVMSLVLKSHWQFLCGLCSSCGLIPRKSGPGLRASFCATNPVWITSTSFYHDFTYMYISPFLKSATLEFCQVPGATSPPGYLPMTETNTYKKTNTKTKKHTHRQRQIQSSSKAQCMLYFSKAGGSRI